MLRNAAVRTPRNKYREVNGICVCFYGAINLSFEYQGAMVVTRYLQQISPYIFHAISYGNLEKKNVSPRTVLARLGDLATCTFRLQSVNISEESLGNLFVIGACRCFRYYGLTG